MKGLEDRARFNVMLVWLSARMKSQGGKPIDCNADLQDDYFDALEDIRIERLEWGAKHIFKTETWFPVPKVLRDAAMLAPSSVLPQITLKQQEISEFTADQVRDAKERFEAIANGICETVNVRGKNDDRMRPVSVIDLADEVL